MFYSKKCGAIKSVKIEKHRKKKAAFAKANYALVEFAHKDSVEVHSIVDCVIVTNLDSVISLAGCWPGEEERGPHWSRLPANHLQSWSHGQCCCSGCGQIRQGTHYSWTRHVVEDIRNLNFFFSLDILLGWIFFILQYAQCHYALLQVFTLKWHLFWLLLCRFVYILASYCTCCFQNVYNHMY